MIFPWGRSLLSDALHFLDPGVVISMQGLLGRRPEATRHIARVWCQMSKGVPLGRSLLSDALHFLDPGAVLSMQGLLGRRPEATRHIAQVWCQVIMS